jgi:hypothetical protein
MYKYKKCEQKFIFERNLTTFGLWRMIFAFHFPHPHHTITTQFGAVIVPREERKVTDNNHPLSRNVQGMKNIFEYANTIC